MLASAGPARRAAAIRPAVAVRVADWRTAGTWPIRPPQGSRKTC